MDAVLGGRDRGRYDSRAAWRLTAADLFALGNAQVARGEMREAVANLERAYLLEPTPLHAQGATVAALAAQDWAFAKRYGRRACKLAPRWPENWYRLGAAHWSCGEWKEAQRCFTRTLSLNPKHLGAHNMSAMLAGFRGDHESEMFHVERLLSSEKVQPLDTFDTAHALLWLGRYQEGWAAYETRHQLPMVINGWHKPEGLDPAKRWDGKTPVKHLLVYHEQGHGDAIQMARYHLDLWPLCENLTVLVHASLVALFRKSWREWDVLPLTPGEPAPPHDAYVGAMSLPHLFGTTVETVPPPADFGMRWKDPRNRWQEALGSKRRIALCTKGGAVASLDLDRSCHDGSFDRLKQLEGYEIVDFTGRVGDYLDTARDLLGCELLITVDTSIAHLGGSLGIPTWIIPPTHFEWRHPRGRDVNPWYDSWVYFRRRKSNDWPYVVDLIIKALEAR